MPGDVGWRTAMGGLKEGFGSGFDAFWGVFEATAAFFGPLLADFKPALVTMAPTAGSCCSPHPLVGPLGTVSQGRPAKLLVMEEGRRSKVSKGMMRGVRISEKEEE